MPIAGPVFTEWYWTPIFLAIFYGPPILAVAGALHLLARFTGWRRRTRAALALALAPALVIGGVAVAGTAKHRRAEAADARQVTFGVFEARGLHQTRAEVHAGLRSRVIWGYERGGREFFVTQLATRDDDVTPPQCAVHDGTLHASWDGPCRAVRTSQGRVVTLADTPDPSLLAVREGTLIVAGSWGTTEADLLAYADALRPVALDDVHWER